MWQKIFILGEERMQLRFGLQADYKVRKIFFFFYDEKMMQLMIIFKQTTGADKRPFLKKSNICDTR